MAQCEQCGTKGFDMRDMKVDQEKRTFVGPCCNKTPVVKEEIEYGIEFSSHMGLKAYATYGGLTLEFKRTREELKAWLESGKQEVTEESQEPEGPPDVVTSATPVNQKEMPN